MERIPLKTSREEEEEDEGYLFLCVCINDENKKIKCMP